MSAWLFDGVLGLSLLWLAARAVFGTDLFNAILAFIGLGLVLALAWLRLKAPDVALAEAALGGGVTGALLLGAYRRLQEAQGSQQDQGTQEDEDTTPVHKPLFTVVLTTLLVMAIGALLVWALWHMPSQTSGLSQAVKTHLSETGVQAEVTAVLLNYRGYDTVLELAVLLAALFGCWQLRPMASTHSHSLLQPGPVLQSLVRLLIPLMILVSGYTLWLGGHSTGGAFQAGALLAGAGVLLLILQPESLALRNRTSLRGLLVLGPGVFALVALACLWGGGMLLEYPRAHAGGIILVIEAVSALTVGLTLTLLFTGGRPLPPASPSPLPFKESE